MLSDEWRCSHDPFVHRVRHPRWQGACEVLDAQRHRPCLHASQDAPDADNFSKAALDGCNAIIFRDDRLVTDLIVRKRYSERPRLVITVETETEYA